MTSAPSEFTGQPPYDHHAEAAVLGALLIDRDAIYQVAETLAPQDFHHARHQYCYASCLELMRSGEAIDQITLARALHRQELLEATGGIAYLAELIRATPTSVNISHYAAIVADTAARRRLFAGGQRITELALQEQDDTAALLKQALDLLATVAITTEREGLRHLASEYDYLLQDQPGPDATDPANSIPTGFQGIDRMLDNMQRSDLLVVGARPGVGKTALALNIAANAARQGAVCGIFSLEMSRHQIAMRLLAAQCAIDLHRIRHGLYLEAEYNRLVDAIGQLSGLPIYVDDRASQNTQQMQVKSRRLQLEQGLDLLVIDYLQLIRSERSGRTEGNRATEIGAICRDLKTMAKELNVPVIACAQLNRSIEQRANRRPHLADLRESGAIEQDADVVVLMSREDQHTTEAEWEQLHPGQPYPRNVVDLNIAKHRHGPTGNTQLYFRDTVMCFYDIDAADQAKM